MKENLKILRIPLVIGSLAIGLLLIACTAPEVASPETAMTQPPPTAVPMSPPAAPVAVDDFETRRQAVSEEWDQLHDDFDQWSSGLTMCHPNAMNEALNGFAVSFNQVTVQARDLSRGKTSGEIADLLIVAATDEETAFRQLRDRWQPNNVSLFENVELQRAKSATAQKSAEDRVIELRDGFEEAADPEATAEFLEAYEPIQADWEQLHKDYETLRDDAESLGPDGVLEGLEKHDTALEEIAAALDELPDLDGAEDTVEALNDAITAERDSIAAAITEIQGGDASAAATADSAAETAETAAAETTADETADESKGNGAGSGAAGSNGSNGGGAKLPDFEALDAAMEASEQVLEDAEDVLDELADPDAEKGLAELAVFDVEYQRLVRSWDSFHDRYNDWRENAGGCDRGEVVEQLDQFGLRMSRIARDVRGLPNSGYLLPIYTLLTEAAARDENAVRALRYTWHPFTLEPFKAVHQERIHTEGLRRQADIAVQDIQNRF